MVWDHEGHTKKLGLYSGSSEELLKVSKLGTNMISYVFRPIILAVCVCVCMYIYIYENIMASITEVSQETIAVVSVRNGSSLNKSSGGKNGEQGVRFKKYLKGKTLQCLVDMSKGEGKVWDDSLISGLGHWVDGSVIT